MNSNFYILVPRQKHFKNNIKIVKFDKMISPVKKTKTFYKIHFKNNIFIIKEISSYKQLESIKQYIEKISLYAKIVYYKNTSKKILLER